MPPGAIEIANKKVAEIVAPPTADSEPTSSARKHYIKLTQVQRFTVGKRAAQNNSSNEVFFLQLFRPVRFVEGDHRQEAEKSVPRASLS